MKIFLGLLLVGISSWADIGLVTEAGSPMVVFAEGESVIFRNCDSYTLDISRLCKPNGDDFRLSVANYVKNLAHASSLPENARSFLAIEELGLKLSRLEYAVANSDDPKAAQEKVGEVQEELRALIRRLFILKTEIADYLAEGKNLSLHQLLEPEKFDLVFGALMPQFLHQVTLTSPVFHVKYSEGKQLEMKAKSCSHGWKFLPRSFLTEEFTRDLKKSEVLPFLRDEAKMSNRGKLSAVFWYVGASGVPLKGSVLGADIPTPQVHRLPETPRYQVTSNMTSGDLALWRQTTAQLAEFQSAVDAALTGPGPATVMCYREYDSPLEYWVKKGEAKSFAKEKP